MSKMVMEFLTGDLFRMDKRQASGKASGKVLFLINAHVTPMCVKFNVFPGLLVSTVLKEVGWGLLLQWLVRFGCAADSLECVNFLQA